MSEWFARLRAQRMPILLIGIPLLVCGLYLALLSKDRYVSESHVIVKEAGRASSAGLNLGSLLTGSAGSSHDDAVLLKQYIESPDMLARIEARMKFKETFRHAGLDFLNRLRPDATREDVLKYYLRRVSVNVDDKTEILVIRSQGFTPEYARDFNQALLDESEHFLNEMSHKISRGEMEFSRGEVERSYGEVKQAREAVLAFENKTGTLDPLASAQASARMIAEMQAKQAEIEAELRDMMTYLNDSAPQVVAKKNALNALRTQIDIEKAKLSAPDDGRMNRQAAQYTELNARLEFALDLYKVSLSTFEKARIETSEKAKSLAVIVSPNLPEEAEYPRSGHTLASLALGLLLLYGLVRLTISIIEDHRT
jgi:capsular polysaccharide transport system permease protein